MPDELGEKTEQATPKRREDARLEGNVARSQDLSGVVGLIVATLMLAVMALWMLGQGKLLMAAMLDRDVVTDPLDPGAAWDTVRFVGSRVIRVMAPLLLIAWVAAFLAQFMQVGFIFSVKSLQPSLGKLNPIKGAQRILGLRGVVKASIDSVKVAIVVTVAVWTISGHVGEVINMPYLTMMQCLATIGALMFDVALRLLAVLLVLAIIDFMYQRWQYRTDLKMTKQSVKDEMKNTEGDPEVKRRRLRMQHQIAMQRVSSAVPQADVVVTNPEHVAVAIKYDADRMNAPRVVAKGADYLAMRIRQIALQHAIPIVERKPLARALYRDVQVGQEVPPDLYAAIAEVLAYVYRMSGKMAS